MKKIFTALAAAGLLSLAALSAPAHAQHNGRDGYYAPPPVVVVPAPQRYYDGDERGARWQGHDRRWDGRRGGWDRDRDGVPNRYDRDRDGDGVPNRFDRRPDNPYRY